MGQSSTPGNLLTISFISIRYCGAAVEVSMVVPSYDLFQSLFTTSPLRLRFSET